MSEFKNVSDLDKVVEVLAKYKYTLDNENAGLVIPGTRTDRSMVKVQNHKNAQI